MSNVNNVCAMQCNFFSILNIVTAPFVTRLHVYLIKGCQNSGDKRIRRKKEEAFRTISISSPSFCSCDKVYHKQKLCYPLCLRCRIVTWQPCITITHWIKIHHIHVLIKMTVVQLYPLRNGAFIRKNNSHYTLCYLQHFKCQCARGLISIKLLR